nr:unnamed protein product [Callosobruchus analis]
MTRFVLEDLDLNICITLFLCNSPCYKPSHAFVKQYTKHHYGYLKHADIDRPNINIPAGIGPTNSVEWLAEHFLRDKFEIRGGDPGFQSGVAEDIGVHQTTVSLTVHQNETNP